MRLATLMRCAVRSAVLRRIKLHITLAQAELACLLKPQARTSTRQRRLSTYGSEKEGEAEDEDFSPPVDLGTFRGRARAGKERRGKVCRAGDVTAIGIFISHNDSMVDCLSSQLFRSFQRVL